MVWKIGKMPKYGVWGGMRVEWKERKMVKYEMWRVGKKVRKMAKYGVVI
jgi:hypothetical protein